MDTFPVGRNPDSFDIEFEEDQEPGTLSAIKIEDFMFKYCSAQTYNELFVLFFKFLLANNITNTKRLKRELNNFHDYLQREYK